MAKRSQKESLTLEERDLADLRENPHNAKTHPPEQVRALAASVKEFGTPKVTITVDEKDVLLAGHGMRLGILDAVAQGWHPTSTVRVMVARGWSETKKRAFLEADNRLGELSGWDEDKRRRELQHLREQGFPVLAMGWERGLDEFISAGAPPPSFPTFGEDLETEHQCPSCGYKWSGQSAPQEAEQCSSGSGTETSTSGRTSRRRANRSGATTSTGSRPRRSQPKGSAAPSATSTSSRKPR